MNKKKLVSLLVLSLSFVLSVLVRVDNIKAPMGKHHEYITAHVLCTDYRFYTEGANTFFYSPVMNFNSPAEQKAAIYYLIRDQKSNFYYYSYPPFTFIFPHIIFKCFNSEPSVIGIRIVGLCIHFLCAFLIYILILNLFKRDLAGGFYFPAYIAYLLYLFSTGNLWYHCNLFFSDILVQPFMLLLIILLLKIFNNSKGNRVFPILLFIVSFLAVYTEYIALFFLFFTCIFLMVKSIYLKEKIHFLFALIIGFAVLSALGLIVFQYSSISSFEGLKEAMIQKYFLRSGYTDASVVNGASINNSMSFDILAANYETQYSHLLDYVWISTLIILFVIIFKRDLLLKYLNKASFFMFAIVLFTFLSHILVFFNFNVIHDFGTLKSTLLLVPFIGFTIGILFEWASLNFKKVLYIFCGAYTLLFIHLSLTQYYLNNDPSTRAKFVTEIPYLVEKYANKNVFVSSNTYFTYETCFYSKRRVEAVSGINELKGVLKHCNIKEGILFYKENDYYNVVKINQEGDTLLFAKESIKTDS